MSKDDKIFNALRDPSAKRISVWAWYGVAGLFGLASPPLGLTFFICILVWRSFTKYNLQRGLFQRNGRFDSLSLSFVQGGGLRRHSSVNEFEFLYTKKYGTIRSKEKFLVMMDEGDVLLITPEMYWARLDFREAVGSTAQIKVKPFTYIWEVADTRNGDEIIRWDWNHKTKSGERDYRYNAEKTYVVRRFGCSLAFENNQRIELRVDSRAECEVLCGRLQLLTLGHPNPVEIDGAERSDEEADEAATDEDSENEDSDEDDTEAFRNPANQSSARHWTEVLAVNPGATKQAIKEARDRLVRGLHPDRLKGIEGLSPDLEKYATKRLVEINLAYEKAMAEMAHRN